MARRQTSFAIKAAVAAMGIALSGAAMAATVQFGTADNNLPTTYNPFGSPDLPPYDPLTGYQQLYDASHFGTGEYRIDSVSFYVPDGGYFDGATFDLSFGYSSTAIGGLNTIDNTTPLNSFASVTVAAGQFIADDSWFTFTFNNSNPIVVFDASAGKNLLLDVNISGLAPSGYSNDVYFRINTLGGTDAMLEAAGAACCTSFDGLVTSFNVTAVPEPETYAMMLAGLGALGFMARRRQFKG